MLGQPKLKQTNLLLDIGNTSIKYAWYGYPNDIADLQVLRTSMDSLPDLLSLASACFYCTVKGDDTSEQVKEMCAQHSISAEQVHTQAIQFGLSNAYTTESNMGADRWVAMLAGAALTQNDYLIIDAGTAITCDFVVNNKHQGGWIAPGLSMARETVVKNTQRVFDDNTLPFTLDLGADTPDCVAQGALAQLTGMIVQAISMMQTKLHATKHSGYSKFDVFMSGGDAPLLISAYSDHQKQLSSFQQSSVNINYIENLVLVGLARIAHENASTGG